jgi:predicted nucleic acid-binding protein
MHRLFLDANVLFSAGYKDKTGLHNLWNLTDTLLISSTYATEEAMRNLRAIRPYQIPCLENLLSFMEIGTDDYSHETLFVPMATKDIPILQAAICMKATHLLTGDKRDFGHVCGQIIQGVHILSPRMYMEEVLNGGGV